MYAYCTQSGLFIYLHKYRCTHFPSKALKLCQNYSCFDSFFTFIPAFDTTLASSVLYIPLISFYLELSVPSLTGIWHGGCWFQMNWGEFVSYAHGMLSPKLPICAVLWWNKDSQDHNTRISLIKLDVDVTCYFSSDFPISPVVLIDSIQQRFPILECFNKSITGPFPSDLAQNEKKVG